MKQNIYDLIIVGAGPAGIAAGIYAKERNIQTLTLEAHTVGGQLTALYPYKEIHDFPSYPSILASILADKMKKHAQIAGVNIVKDDKVCNIVKKDNLFTVESTKQIYTAKSVLLASGMGFFQPNKLGVKGEEELVGKGVFYQMLPGDDFKGRKLVFIGGGDTALELVIMAARRFITTLVHRKDSFRALEKNVKEIKTSRVKIMTDSEVIEIIGSKKVDAVLINNTKTSSSEKLECDGVIICCGMKMGSNLADKLGLKTENNALVVDSCMQTSTKGIFAAGDIAVPAGFYKRILVAQGQAAAAINGVYKYLKNPYW